MCDKDHFEEDLEKYRRAGRVTRRDFGTLTAGVGVAMMLPRAANAQAAGRARARGRDSNARRRL
jgi:hypothetical protein